MIGTLTGSGGEVKKVLSIELRTLRVHSLKNVTIMERKFFV